MHSYNITQVILSVSKSLNFHATKSIMVSVDPFKFPSPPPMTCSEKYSNYVDIYLPKTILYMPLAETST